MESFQKLNSFLKQQQRFKSDCASTLSGQSLSFSPEDMLDPWLPINRLIWMYRLIIGFDGRICQLVPYALHNLSMGIIFVCFYQGCGNSKIFYLSKDK